MTVAILVIVTIILAVLIWMLWVLSNIRDDQLVIRTWIAHVLRERRRLMGAPMEDEAFHKWLTEHPDRPYRDDPPFAK